MAADSDSDEDEDEDEDGVGGWSPLETCTRCAASPRVWRLSSMTCLLGAPFQL